jgi:hypothetical protein
VRGAKDGVKLVVAADNQDATGFTKVVFRDGEFRILDADNVTLQTVLHSGSTFSLDAYTIEDETRTRLEPGAMLRAGDSFSVAASPNPLCLVSSDGSLISRNFWSELFDCYVLGNADSSVPSKTYAQGLVRGGEAFDSSDPSTAKFLRADGQFVNLTTDGVTGSVASNCLSLSDFPDDFSGTHGSFLRVHPTTGSVVFDPAVDTGAIGEGTNLYYTDARVRSVAEGGTIGQLQCQSLLTLSDVRVKSECERIPDSECLAESLRLLPTKFVYNHDKKKQVLGLLAHEAERYSTKGNDGLLRLDYSQITSQLIGAVRAQQKQISALQTAVERILMRLS